MLRILESQPIGNFTHGFGSIKYPFFCDVNPFKLYGRSGEMVDKDRSGEIGMIEKAVSETKNQIGRASTRISSAFLEVLEHQFPVDSRHPIQFRYASQFAEHLNIHVTHLNRSIKESLNKTTTQAISERILQEAKILLHDRDLSMADIAFALGFTEVTHFNNFFKKRIQLSQTKFRVV
jgi:AraC family transcriptional activator of pobA